jgi:hypothetical protein
MLVAAVADKKTVEVCICPGEIFAGILECRILAAWESPG